jgi:hypothetical protein
MDEKTLAEMRQSFKEILQEIQDDAKKEWDGLTEDQKLGATIYIFTHLKQHLMEGGTFRYLIYERLGFDLDAYLPLYSAGGMDISNCFYDNRNAVKENDVLEEET